MFARIKMLLMLVRDVLLSPVVLLMPRNPKKIVFGAWLGKQFSDNPKYFLKWCLKNTDLQCYWIAERQVRPQVEQVPGVCFVERGTLAAYWHFLTAKWSACNILWQGDIMYFPTCGRMVNLNFWHGISLKKIGAEQFNGRGPDAEKKRSRFRRLIHHACCLLNDAMSPYAAWTTCSNGDMVDILHRSCQPRFCAERTIVAGQPRNDFLVENRANVALRHSLKAKYARLLDLPIDKKWYLYLPTWRHDLKDTFSFLRADRRMEFERLLQEQGAVLVEKQHPIVLNAMQLGGARANCICVLSAAVSARIDLQELLLVGDRLITDYSSCFFDFETLRRPIVHFAYDYEFYKNTDSGLEYELQDVAGGAVVETEDALVAKLKETDEELLLQRGPRAEELVAGEAGHACERFAKWTGLV